MQKHEQLYPDFFVIQSLAYEPSGLVTTKIEQELESKEYGAYFFEINEKSVLFRVAKITPTKTGQFVTLWKRIGDGPIMPYDMADAVAFFVVVVQSAGRCGQFVFPKMVLCQKGFVSKEGKGGKRAMRVYPPWDVVESEQAVRTQSWQCLYFVEIQPFLDVERTRQLFLGNSR